MVESYCKKCLEKTIHKVSEFGCKLICLICGNETATDKGRMVLREFMDSIEKCSRESGLKW